MPAFKRVFSLWMRAQYALVSTSFNFYFGRGQRDGLQQ
jgi:hypothetical protein